MDYNYRSHSKTQEGVRGEKQELLEAVKSQSYPRRKPKAYTKYTRLP
jgi:hypothetical protein